MTQELSGKVVLVTGAASGIGRSSALRIAAAGANLVASDIAAEAGRALVEEVRSHGHEATFIRADIGLEADVAALIEGAVDMYGRLDGAFNNAGVVQTGKLLHELTTDEWNRAINIDLNGVFWCIKYEVLAMQKSGGGAIVNTASSLGQVAIARAAEYVAAKHGVMGLTRAAAADYGASGIRVNAIQPGIIETPIVANLAQQSEEFRIFLGKLKERHPIGRFGQPEEIGEAAVWLLSDAASFVNGATVPIDGGYLAV